MDEGDDGTIGAIIKLIPRGVGNWSPIGDSHGLGTPNALGVGAPLDISSSSIIVLSDLLLMRTCAGGCGGGV
jgi:hypothetical protein